MKGIFSYIGRSELNDKAVLLLRQYANALAARSLKLKLSDELRCIADMSKPYVVSEVTWRKFEWLLHYCVPSDVVSDTLNGNQTPMMEWTEPYVAAAKEIIMNSSGFCPIDQFAATQMDNATAKPQVTVGYHVNKISKGQYGQVSKIKEEYEELMDAVEQKNKVMTFNEMADLVGAIEGYAVANGLTLNDLMVMNNATKRAFAKGERS